MKSSAQSRPSCQRMGTSRVTSTVGFRLFTCQRSKWQSPASKDAGLFVARPPKSLLNLELIILRHNQFLMRANRIPSRLFLLAALCPTLPALAVIEPASVDKVRALLDQ